jgi:hypothetical protein
MRKSDGRFGLAGTFSRIRGRAGAFVAGAVCAKSLAGSNAKTNAAASQLKIRREFLGVVNDVFIWLLALCLEL